MKRRVLQGVVLVGALAFALMPCAIAADLTDVGFIDQAAIGSLPAFAAANQKLQQEKSQMYAQFTAQLKAAKSDAQRQDIVLAAQQRFSDKQRELVGPLFLRAQLAIAQVSAGKNLSVVLDKRIIVYGGQDITGQVTRMLQSNQAIPQPSVSPSPSAIGFVDQQALDALPKVKAANDDLTAFVANLRKTDSAKIATATSDAAKQQIGTDYNAAVTAKQKQLLDPLVAQTKSATESVARKKNLLLVVDQADVIYGGTDITQDVQNALSK